MKPDIQTALPPPWTDRLPAAALAITLLLPPFFPDEKLNRLKLIALGAGLVLCGLLWALRQAAASKITLSRTPMDWPVALYGMAAFLFYRSSRNPATAASEFQRMIFSLGAYFAAVQCLAGPDAGKKRRWAAAGWAAGAALISVYGILQKSGGIGRLQVPQMERVFATFGNPIFFAAYLIISIPVALGALLEYKRAWSRAGFLTAIVLASWALFYTGTRAAFLALPAALLIFYVLLEMRAGWLWSMRIWRNKGKLAVAAAAVIALLMSSPKIRDAVHASRATATSQTHTLIWKDVFKMWKAHPWLGTGFGTFHVEFPQYASDELKAAWPQNERIVNDAHNEFLQTLAETGLAGFSALCLILISFYASAHRYFWSSPEPSPLFAGLVAGVTALLIQNFFSVDMRFIVSSAYLYLGMGFAASFFSREVSIPWPAEGQRKLAKALWLAAFILASGVGGFFHKRLDFGLLSELARPYRANRELKAQPDFFEEKYPESIEGLEALAKQFPERWQVWDKLGYAYAKEIEKKDAAGNKSIQPAMAERSVGAYLKAHKLNPKAEGPPNNIGNIFYTLHRAHEAIEWWKEAVRINPERLDARLNLGIAYFYQGKIKESSAQMEEVLKRDPRNKTALVLLKRMVE